MVTRRLAAIMFTDIVGYSSLMQKEESLAISLVNRYEKILTQCIETQRGEIINHYGDGSLIVFHSATEAIRCAINIQILLQDDPVVPLRIGVHIGEILIDGDKVFGDGVNIASRIESSGVAGSVLFSQNVYEKIRNKKEFHCHSLGHFAFKNIASDIHVYTIKHPMLPFPKAIELKGSRRNENTESIAVLPFTNMSNDPDQNYFCDGLCEELIHAFSQIKGLKVASRRAVFKFKDDTSDIKSIGKDLGVNKVLHGSVRKSGDNLRITVHLTDVENGLQIWSHRFDRELQDIFKIQDEITSAVINSFESVSKKVPVLAKINVNLVAYESYLQAKFYFNKRSAQNHTKAIELLEQSVKSDPQFGKGFALLALAYIEQFFTYDPSEEWEKKAFVAIEKAKNINIDLPEIYLAKGNLIWTKSHGFPHTEAIEEYKLAIQKDPVLVEAYNELARVLWHVGLLDMAYACFLKTTHIDPYFIDGHFRFGWLEMHRGNYKTSLRHLRKIPSKSLTPSTEVLMAQNLLYLGKIDEALAKMESVDIHLRNKTEYCSMAAVISALKGNAKEAEDQIKESIDSGKNLGHFHHNACNFAEAYAILNKIDKSIYWLKYTIDEGFPCHPWFERNPWFDNIKEDHQFQDLLKATKKKMEGYANQLKDFSV